MKIERFNADYFIDSFRKRVSCAGIEFLEIYLSNYYGKIRAYLWKNVKKFEKKACKNSIINCSIELIKPENMIYHIIDYKFNKHALMNMSDLFGLRNKYLECGLQKILLVNITDNFLQKIVKVIFEDRALIARFIRWPASINGHHSKKGGLLKHTVETMHVAKDELFKHGNRNRIEKEIILLSIFLHDIGKIASYTECGNKFHHSNIWKYIHHADLSFYYFFNRALKVKKYPDDIVKLAKIASCILYHHEDSRKGYKHNLHRLIQKFDSKSIYPTYDITSA